MPTSRALLRRLAAVVALTTSIGVVAIAPPAGAATVDFERVAGADRFESAAILATELYPVGGLVAFVATGRDYADALAAGPAAGAAVAPVLLTERDTLPAATASALDVLKPQNIILVGGPAAVSDEVATELEEHVPGFVIRLSGADRYATSVEVADYVFEETVDTVYLATGQNFPDALAAGGSAGADLAPLLLTLTNDVPDTVLTKIDALDPIEVVLLGGTAAISDAVKTEIEGLGIPVVRRSGATRYDTAAALSAASFAVDGGHPAGGAVFLVNGERFPDALAAGAPAGPLRSPVLLTEKECIPKATNDEINRLAASLPAEEELTVIAVGGFEVLGDLVVIDRKVCG